MVASTAGKTTTIGKLANQLRVEGRTPLICAADTFRAAAVDQLQIWADRAGVDIIRAKDGSDPAAVVHDAMTAAKLRRRDVVLVDTAGRLHTRTNLMNELDKIRASRAGSSRCTARSAAVSMRPSDKRCIAQAASSRTSRRDRHRADEARRYGQRRGGGGDCVRVEAADSLRRRRRRRGRPAAL